MIDTFKSFYVLMITVKYALTKHWFITESLLVLPLTTVGWGSPANKETRFAQHTNKCVNIRMTIFEKINDPNSSVSRRILEMGGSQ